LSDGAFFDALTENLPRRSEGSEGFHGFRFFATFIPSRVILRMYDCLHLQSLHNPRIGSTDTTRR